MRIAILSRGDGWHVQDLIRATSARGHVAEAVDFRRISASAHTRPLSGYDALLVRTMPAGSLEQVVFRMDVLHGAGVPVLNPPRAVETCVDKFLTSARLAAAGLPTPVTIACQQVDEAMAAFNELGGDVVVKPLFGAEGRGMVRVADRELAWRTFHAIEQTRGVIYLQRFVKHPGWDIRVFVLNGKVLAAMKRTNPYDWRANVAQGGKAERYELGRIEGELAEKAAVATGAIVTGVDLLLDERKDWQVIEVNAVPGWRALGPVCGIDVGDLVVRFLVEEYYVSDEQPSAYGEWIMRCQRRSWWVPRASGRLLPGRSETFTPTATSPTPPTLTSCSAGVQRRVRFGPTSGMAWVRRCGMPSPAPGTSPGRIPTCHLS